MSVEAAGLLAQVIATLIIAAALEIRSESVALRKRATDSRLARGDILAFLAMSLSASASLSFGLVASLLAVVNDAPMSDALARLTLLSVVISLGLIVYSPLYDAFIYLFDPSWFSLGGLKRRLRKVNKRKDRSSRRES